MTSRYLTGLLLCLLLPSVPAAEPVAIMHGWISESPPGVRVNAGYMDIVNNADTDITLTAVASPDFKQVELHKTITGDGQARMQKQENILIAAGAALTLEPGGLHLMLMEPLSRVIEGNYVTVKFTFDSGFEKTMLFPVRRGLRHHHGHH